MGSYGIMHAVKLMSHLRGSQVPVALVLLVKIMPIIMLMAVTLYHFHPYIDYGTCTCMPFETPSVCIKCSL